MSTLNSHMETEQNITKTEQQLRQREPEQRPLRLRRQGRGRHPERVEALAEDFPGSQVAANKMRLRNARKTGQDKADEKKSAKKSKRNAAKSEGSFCVDNQPDPATVEEDERVSDEATDSDSDGDQGGGAAFYVSTEPQSGPEEVEEEDGGHKAVEEDEMDGPEEGSVDSDEDESDEESSSAAAKEQAWSLALGPGGSGKSIEKKKEERERQLQQFLFGDLGDAGGAAGNAADADESEEEEGVDDEDQDGAEQAEVVEKKKGEKRKAVWHDEDDAGILVKDVTATFKKAKGKHGAKETSTEVYSKALKRKYLAIMGTPKWADLGRVKKSGDDSDEEFFRETTDMLDGGKHQELTRDRLSYRKVTDLNDESRSEGSVIRAAEFHPAAAVALVAGTNGTASLFQVDSKANAKVQTVNFADFPIRTAHFSADGGEFICGSGQAKHLNIFDLHKAQATRIDVGRRLDVPAVPNFEVSPAGDYIAVLGRFGQVHLLSSRTKEKAFTIKMNDDVYCAAFVPGGAELLTHGAGGEVFIWDVRQTRGCAHRFADDGCVRGTALAASPDGRYLAAGAESGIVNLYDARTARLSARPKPERILKNLTTRVAKLQFNPSSEILAMSSESKDNAIKLVHVPSRTVFPNFPSWNFNLRRVNCLDFSANGGFLSVGNNRGAANLYRIDHYGGRF